jgi:hypothetical protein
MKHRADQSSLKQYLPFEGILAGDPHMGNFTVLPLKQVGGSRQMRFVDIDFDDAGRGPYVLDLIRYLIASKSIGGQIKKRSLEMSYLAEHGFVFGKGEIEPYNAKIARSTIERLFTAAKVIDLAIRPEERGGSVDQLRIWVLVEDQKSRRIVELKQYSKPAIANYQAQPLNEIRRTFWRRDAVKPGETVEVLFSPLRGSERKGGCAEEAHRGRDRRGLHCQHWRAGAAGARMSWGLSFRPAAALTIGVLIGAPFALGQELSGPPPKDTIFARKILMGAIDMNMDEIETMLAPNGKLDAQRRGSTPTPFRSC